MTPELIAGGNTVKQATDDVDTMIVSAALESALIKKTVTVFGNNADLIIMLLHHWNEEMTKKTVKTAQHHRSNFHVKCHCASTFTFHSCIWWM